MVHLGRTESFEEIAVPAESFHLVPRGRHASLRFLEVLQKLVKTALAVANPEKPDFLDLRRRYHGGHL